MSTSVFQKKIWNFYKTNKRDFPWRETTDPYKIMVSEMMLQQTQTSRVLPKYHLFLERFPIVESLAQASNVDVLKLWSGLGYNRRALYLKKSTEIIAQTKDWVNPEFLETLPGIGPNTAGAIYVFSTNKHSFQSSTSSVGLKPYVFIETNIRRVFIHEFFKDQENILDKDLLELVKKTLDHKKPRDWYYALMDYGAYLGKIGTNPNRKSKHYLKQSKFEGSLRQIRGKILRILLEQKKISTEDLKKQFENKAYLEKALSQLIKEGFVIIQKSIITLTP